MSSRRHTGDHGLTNRGQGGEFEEEFLFGQTKAPLLVEEIAGNNPGPPITIACDGLSEAESSNNLQLWLP